jgi:hypothetical protein
MPRTIRLLWISLSSKFVDLAPPVTCFLPRNDFCSLCRRPSSSGGHAGHSHSRDPCSTMPSRLNFGELPQDLSVHRSHFGSSHSPFNNTPAHGGVTVSGNGTHGVRNSASPGAVLLPAHSQSPYSAHRGIAREGRNPWPKDEIQVGIDLRMRRHLAICAHRFSCSRR